jgi:hypothetical protein
MFVDFVLLSGHLFSSAAIDTKKQRWSFEDGWLILEAF